MAGVITRDNTISKQSVTRSLHKRARQLPTRPILPGILKRLPRGKKTLGNQYQLSNTSGDYSISTTKNIWKSR